MKDHQLINQTQLHNNDGLESTLVNLESSLIELDQIVDIPNVLIDTSQYELLKGGKLHFAGFLNLNEDNLPELILIVEHPRAEFYVGFSLVVLDGEDYELLFEITELMPEHLNFDNLVRYVNFSSSPKADLLLRFSTGEACNYVLIDTLNFNYFDFQSTCTDFEFILDSQNDGSSELMLIDNLGNYFLYDLQTIFSTKTKSSIDGNIFPIGYKESASLIQFGNFTGDNVRDWVVVNSNPTSQTSEFKILDGLSRDFLTNFTKSGVVPWIHSVNINGVGTDEIIYSSPVDRRIQAFNSTLWEIEYSNINLLPTVSDYNVIQDIDNDMVEDVLITNPLYSIILSGKSGEAVLFTSINSAIKSSVPSTNTIEVGVLSDTFSFVRHLSAKGIIIYSHNNGLGIDSNFEDTWLESLVSTNRTYDETLLSYSFKNIDLFQDKDGDQLTSYEEFLIGTKDFFNDTDNDKILDFDELDYRTNPINEDSEYDGIPDLYEIENKLNPLIYDSNQDTDGDGLTHLREYTIVTDPHKFDTDEDGMDDGWEDKYGLTPTDFNQWVDTDEDGLRDLEEYELGLYPNNNDSDDDGMPDKWEVDYGLRGLIDDSKEDPDDDELSNLDEYYNLTNPNDWDTDNDELPDGWEVKYGLLPLEAEDDWDLDGDFLSNKLEYKIGTNPNGKFDRFLAYFIILVLLISPLLGIFRYRKLSQKAKTAGFDSYWIKRKITKLGFKTLVEYQDAKENGFLSAGARNLVFAYGFSDISSLKFHWNSIIEEMQNNFEGEKGKKYNFDELETKINTTRFQKELVEINAKLQNVLKEVDSDLKQMNQIVFEIKNLENLYHESNLEPFLDISLEILKTYEKELDQYILQLTQNVTNLTHSVDRRKEWFEPWNSLLSLIRVTNDQEGVTLKEISRIINTTEGHTEELILLLLEENKFIGVYDSQNKIYTKGSDVEDYISFVLREFVQLEKEENKED